MAGPIIVEGPDGQEYEFPAGTSPDVMKQAMRKRYPSSTAVPAATPATGKQAALDARNAQIRERQDLTGKAMKAVRDVQDIQRKRRVEPVAKAADIAAAQAEERYRAETPFYDRTDRMMYRDAARQGVYQQAGVVSPSDAFTGQTLNALTLGAPAIANKDVRQFLTQAESDQPLSSLGGQVVGFLGPGALVETGLQGLSRAAQPIVSRLMPQGGSAIERSTRVAGRTVGLAGSGATQSGVYQATVGESLAAGREDRAPSLAGAAEGFKTGATDPIAILALPAALGANRLLTYIASGGATATPANIAAQIDQATGRLLNPRRAIGQTLETSAVGANIRPQAMDRIIRELESAGLSVEDISRLMESVQQRLSSLPEAQASRLTFGQALAEATARDRPQALPTILATLRERRLSGRKGDTSAGIISGVTQDLERSQIDFLSDSISRNIGDTTLPEVDEQIRLARAAISQQYNQVLAQADPTRPEARGIAMIVAGDKSKGVLSRRAANAGFENVDAYIAARPDEAGHWLRSALSKASRKAPEGREKIELQDTVSQLDELLETNEGYRQARMQWGHEAGLEEAQDWATNFTNVARDEGAVSDLLAELNRMPEPQRNVAMSSLRNEVLKSVRGGPEDASLRLSKWMTRGALDALEQLGEGGRALADDLRFLGREQRWLFKVDPETLSPTAVRMLSAQTAQQAGNAPVSNLLTGAGQPGSIVQDVAISAIANQPVPIMTAQRVLRGASNAIFRPRTETLQDVARLYMGRRGNIPTPTERPDFTPLFNRVPPAAIPPASGTPPTPPQGGPPPAGGTPPTLPQGGRTVGAGRANPAPIVASGLPGLRTDAGNAAFGAGMGALGPAETPEERARNMAIGAGLMGVGGRVGRTVGQPRPASGQTVGMGSNPYINRRSMQLAAPRGPGEETLALREEWRPLMPAIATARATAEDAIRLAEQARTPQQIEQAKAALDTLRNQVSEMRSARGGANIEKLKAEGFNIETPLYHGTGIAGIKQLRKSDRGELGPGVYLTDEYAVAEEFAKGGFMPGVQNENPQVLTAVVRGKLASVSEVLQIVYEMPKKKKATMFARGEATQALVDELKQRGFSGIRGSGPQGISVFDPEDVRLISPGTADTAEDLRLQEIIDNLQPTSDPIFMATQASAARQSLDRLGQSLGFEQGGPRGRQALYDEALFDLRGDAPLGMNNAVKVVTEPVIAPDGTVLRKGVAEAVTGAELPISTGRAPPRTVLPRGAEQPSEPRGPGRYAGGLGEAQWNTNQTFFIGSPDKNITEFKVRPTKGRIGQGVYLTPQRELAESYTTKAGTYLPGKKGGKVYEVYIKGNLAPKEEFYKALAEAEAASNVYKTKFSNIEELDKANQKIEQDAQRILKERGFTGFVREHYADGQNFAGEEIVVFDPANVRRVDDPMFKSGRYAGGDDIKPLGFGAGTPKTPQQAARFETPGSPEYEAAVAKGLDMSTEARMARAREMGFDTETVLYHGTATDVASFDPRKAGGVTKARSAKLGTWLTESPKTAEGYADFASGKPVQDLIDASYAAERAGQWDKASRLMAEAEALETAGTAGQTIMPLHVRGKLKTIDMEGVQYDPDDVNLTEIAKAAKQEGFDGVRLTNFSDEAGYGQYNPTTHVLIFDPKNIRSVHAAFDPDKAGSSTLLAAAPFAAVGGAGMTMGAESERRTVGRPREKRTVGKAN